MTAVEKAREELDKDREGYYIKALANALSKVDKTKLNVEKAEGELANLMNMGVYGYWKSMNA